MAKKDEIQQLPLLKKGTTEELKEKKGKGFEDFGGRKAIIVLFVITVFLSLLFWLQSRLGGVFQDFFGPSTWTFSR